MKSRNNKAQMHLTKPVSVIICMLLLTMAGATQPNQTSPDTDLNALINLSETERQLITTIVSANKANREKLTSFDCRYARTSTGLEQAYSGRYAFDSGRIYNQGILDNTGEGSVYVKVDNEAWRTSPLVSPNKMISFSAKGNIPSSLGPWSQMDRDIGSRLDQLISEFDRITSARRMTIDNRQLVVVEIQQRLATDPPEQYKYTNICHFSVIENYLPVRIEHYSTNESGESVISYHKEINKINSYDVNDQKVFLPVEYNGTYYRNGSKYREDKYSVLEETIRINPELPDELFEVAINPGDLFIDKDRELTYTVPADGVIGTQAPDFTLEQLGNGKVTLSEVKEDVIVLDFWATWCGPCEIVAPALEALHTWAKENNKSVAFYSIDLKEDPDIVAQYCKEHDYSIPVLLDSDMSVFSAYKGSGIPYIIIISDGIIRNTHIGAGAEVDVLEQYIKEMVVAAFEQ